MDLLVGIGWRSLHRSPVPVGQSVPRYRVRRSCREQPPLPDLLRLLRRHLARLVLVPGGSFRQAWVPTGRGAEGCPWCMESSEDRADLRAAVEPFPRFAMARPMRQRGRYRSCWTDELVPVWNDRRFWLANRHRHRITARRWLLPNCTRRVIPGDVVEEAARLTRPVNAPTCATARAERPASSL